MFSLALSPDPLLHGEKEDEEGHPGCGLEDEELSHDPVHLVVDVVVPEEARQDLVHGLALGHRQQPALKYIPIGVSCSKTGFLNIKIAA